MIIETKYFQMTPKILATLTLKKKSSRFVFVFFAIPLLQFAGLIFFERPLFSSWTIVYFGMIAILLFIPVFLLLQIKLLENSKNQKLFAQRKFFFDETKMEIETENEGKTTFLWNEILKVRKRKNYYAIYYSLAYFKYLPFDGFQNEKDRMEFEKIIQNKLK